MSVYSIDFSEPLKVGFEIPAGGFDGPGASAGSSHTSLRLHGRGALEWGEAVDEDLVRLTENFASASPPLNRLTGQMWVELKLYHYNGANVFKRFDLVTNTWGPITVQLTQPATPTRGTYWWDGTTLWGYYEISTVGKAAYDWRPRSFSDVGVIADGATSPVPQQTINVYNALANGGVGAWVPPQSVTVSTTDPSTSATLTAGTLWFDTTTGTLNIWNGTAWQALVTSGTASTGNLDMGNNHINNLADPVNPQDALNLQTGNSLYVPLAGNAIGPAMTGSLVLNADPTVALGAATKQYVDTQISSITGAGTATVHNNPVGTFTYAAGDIAIAGGKIYIALAANTSAVPGGDWKQVWPATYA